MSWKRESGVAARTRIHGGLASASRAGTILIANLSNARDVFCAPFSFTPASRIFYLFNEAFCKLQPDDFLRFNKP